MSRRFRVWLVWGREDSKAEVHVSMADSATDEECEEACKDALDGLIASNVESGWEEEAS